MSIITISRIVELYLSRLNSNAMNIYSHSVIYKHRFIFTAICIYCLFINKEKIFASENFVNMNTYFGISLRETNSVVEDHNGFIWSSSKAGIIRISDNNYKLYQPPFVESNISRIKIATQGEQIFLYTNNGQVFIYDEVYDCFKMALNIVDHLNINFLWVYDIIVDDYGKFCIATHLVLFSFYVILEEF